MVRRIIAGVAIAGALMLGTAGAAGATGTAATAPTSPTSSPSPTPTPTSNTTTTTTPCSNLAQLIKHYHAAQARAGKRLHKQAALESRLRRLGHTKLAGMVAKRFNHARAKQKHAEARLHQAVAQCAGKGKGTGSSSSTGSTGSSGSTTSTS